MTIRHYYSRLLIKYIFPNQNVIYLHKPAKIDIDSWTLPADLNMQSFRYITYCAACSKLEFYSKQRHSYVPKRDETGLKQGNYQHTRSHRSMQTGLLTDGSQSWVSGHPEQLRGKKALPQKWSTCMGQNTATTV